MTTGPATPAAAVGELAVVSVVGGLAAYRVWRALAHDDITEPLRARLYPHVAPDGTGPAAGFLRWLQCPWCAGFWVAGATVAAMVVSIDGLDVGPAAAAAAWWAAATIVGLCAMVIGQGG